MFRLAIVPLIAALTAAGSQAQLTVWSAGAVEEGVRALAPRFGREAGHEVVTQFGTGPELEARLASQESADVLIAPAAVVERARKAGKIVEGSEAPVGRVGVGVTVRRGAPHPDISTLESLKAALLRADSIVYNRASTGQYLEGLFSKMGILDQLAGKTTRYGNAAQVLEHVSAGKGTEIGFGPVTEIRTFEPKGVVLVGPLPSDAQNYTTYVAALLSTARSREAGRNFIRYLTSAAGREALAATGVQ